MLMVGPLHWMAVKYIMRYLKGILDLLLPQRHDITLRGFCDADWTGDANDMRSTMGYNFLLALEPFCGNARNNQLLYHLGRRQSAWPLAIAQRKQFGLDNF